MPRTATPKKEPNGTAETTAPMPTKAASHGAPARRYLNEKVTGVLLEGMKRLASEQWVLSMHFGQEGKLNIISSRPEMPLKVLGEFLLQRSAEIEKS